MFRAFASTPTGFLGLVILGLLALDALAGPWLLADRARTFDVFSANQRPAPRTGSAPTRWDAIS